MSKLVRAGLTMATALAVVVAMGGVASAKTLSDGKYVKTLCGSLRGITDAESKLADAYNALDTSDPAAFQTKASGLVDAFVGSVDTAQKKMKKLTPQDGGKKITKLFDGYFTEIRKKLNDAVAKFRSADANGVAFQGDVIQFETALKIFDVGLSDPFSKVKDQSLISAFDSEKSCKAFVTIIGG